MRNDPRVFLEELKPPVIFGEIQNTPEPLDYVRTLIDLGPAAWGNGCSPARMKDSGLACHLLGIMSANELERSPFLGALFEGFVAAEILKAQTHLGMRKELYYFRDQQGLEVDFLLPRPNAGLCLIEARASKTVRPAMAAPLLALRRALSKQAARLLVGPPKTKLAFVNCSDCSWSGGRGCRAVRPGAQ